MRREDLCHSAYVPARGLSKLKRLFGPGDELQRRALPGSRRSYPRRKTR